MKTCYRCGKGAAETVEVNAPSGFREAWCADCVGSDAGGAWSFPLLVLLGVALGLALAVLAAIVAVRS